MFEVTVRDIETGHLEAITVDADTFTGAALAAAETPFSLWGKPAGP